MSKRKSDQYLEMSDEDLDDELENMPMKDSCDTVRRKIRALIDSGEMKVGEFQKAIGTNSVTYGRFMSQNGTYKGSGSSVYYSAWAFFKKRELRGIKAPKKKAKTSDVSNGNGTAAVVEPAAIAAAVRLPGELEDSVAVYDTCDDIRRKINAHLKKDGVTQAQFMRDIAAQFHTETKKLQSKQLNDFRSKKGPYAGNTSAVYYGAYVFFEKLRVAEGKPKGKVREDMEKIHRGGLDTQRRRDHVWAPIGASVTQDRYGRTFIGR